MGIGRGVLSLLCVAVSDVNTLVRTVLTSFSHDVAPKPNFEKTFDRVYKLATGDSCSPPVTAQEIALVFIIIAQGTLYNIEMPPFDSSADGWVRLSELALVKGDFLSNNTIPGLQTLVSHTKWHSWTVANCLEHLMAHMRLWVVSPEAVRTSLTIRLENLTRVVAVTAPGQFGAWSCV
jgi:hypothetical protein